MAKPSKITRYGFIINGCNITIVKKVAVPIKGVAHLYHAVYEEHHSLSDAVVIGWSCDHTQFDNFKKYFPYESKATAIRCAIGQLKAELGFYVDTANKIKKAIKKAASRDIL